MMRWSALLILSMPFSLVAQDSASFDPDAYVQVEVIVFTTETDPVAANRTGVLPELLVRSEPRRFAADLLGIDGASLGQAPDTSWFESEWAELEARLVELDEVQLVRGIRWILQQPDELYEAEPLPAAQPIDLPIAIVEPTGNADNGGESVEADMLEEAVIDGEDAQDEADSHSEEEQAPEELPLWERYRLWQSDLLRNCYRQLDASEWRLEKAGNALRRDPAYSVIMQAAWIQPIGPRANHVLLEGGADDEFGMLSLKRVAFVEAEINLWRPLEEGYAALEESRPLRLRRNYYLDHPMMGAVIRVDPIRVPAEFQ